MIQVNPSEIFLGTPFFSSTPRFFHVFSIFFRVFSHLTARKLKEIIEYCATRIFQYPVKVDLIDTDSRGINNLCEINLSVIDQVT